jgi:hypothetical protein
MRIALDIDGTLDEHPAFFAFLSTVLRASGHTVLILTYRDPLRRQQAEDQLAGWGIVFDELHIARSLGDKGHLCRELAVDIFFDDQDECIVEVDEHTLVLKVRNGGNFDFDAKKWLSTARLTELL